MITVHIGDMFESTSQTLVNTVNCVGIMGRGIALEFKKRFPNMYKDYVARCQRGEVKLGRPYLYKSVVPPWILNFPTKDHWRSVAKLDDIIRGLEYLLEHYKHWGITSITVPPLGCGQGELEWRVVGPTLYRYLNKMDIPVELYAPHGTPHEELQTEFLGRDGSATQVPQVMPEPEWIKPAWVALVEILRRILEQPYRWPVGRTIFQKIAYVATQEGLPTGLEYEKGSFGPFSTGLKRLVSRLLNNGLIQEEREGSLFAVTVGPTYADARKAYAVDLERWEPIIERITDLFMRTTTHQAELVATVIFAAQTLQKAKKDELTEREVVEAIMQWKQRRKPALDEGEVASTVRNLAALGWLQVEASGDLLVPEEAVLDV